MTALLLGILLICTAITTRHSIGVFSPSMIFLTMQYIMALGTFPLLDPLNKADQRHIQMIVWTFVLFAAFTIVGALTLRVSELGSKKYSHLIETVKPNRLILFLIVISVIVCSLYYYAVGYNLLLQSLAGQFEGTEDIAGLRLQAYSGSNYYFPGYVNQFKNVLLPALVTIVIMWVYKKKLAARGLISLGLIFLSLIFIMGSGQRGAMVTFFIVLLVFSSYFGRRILKRALLILLLAGLPLFFLGSRVLDRSGNSMSDSSGIGEYFTALFQELISRMMDSNQLASTVAFRYVDSLPITAGAEWFQSLLGLLPGVAGSTLSNEVFAQLYGSDRGTAPPSIWTSSYHNFGDVGYVVFAVLLSVIYFTVSRQMVTNPATNTLEAIGMAGVTTIMGTWVAGGPDYLLNTGLVVFILLWSWGKRIKTKQNYTLISGSLQTKVSPIN